MDVAELIQINIECGDAPVENVEAIKVKLGVQDEVVGVEIVNERYGKQICCDRFIRICNH